ncbi:MAG: DUF3050 domain-containing protein, partial [Vicinamibacterales bacterium]
AAPSRTMEIARAKAELARHPLYARVDSLPRLRTFVRHHVACVFDFMWLLKSLQRDLAPVTVPWLPPADPDATRLINAIVVDEESDVLPYREGYASHFAWYVEAMEELGAGTGPVRAWVERMRPGSEPLAAMRDAGMPAAACEFVATTLSFLAEPLAIRAAVFFHGREDVIPRMFLPLVERLTACEVPCGRFLSYLQRHIELDGGEHGRAADALLQRLCSADVALRERAEDAALRALDARRQLWDAIFAAL